MIDMEVVLAGIGGFTILLGVWHLGVPVWFHFRSALEAGGREALPPVGCAPLRYGTTTRDVLGVSWIMNVAASYGLITIGIAMLAAQVWVGTPAGRVLALWIAGWWFVRAVAQLAMGRRRLDLLVIVAFGALGVVALLLAAA
jgi:hypothetical protein